MAICTKCGTAAPIEKLWIFANVELREAVCAKFKCDCKTFRIEEVPLDDVYKPL